MIIRVLLFIFVSLILSFSSFARRESFIQDGKLYHKITLENTHSYALSDGENSEIIIDKNNDKVVDS